MRDMTLLFLVRENQILLAMKKRGFGEGRWNGVGGKCEPGETLEQAVVRETQEEISVTPTEFSKVAELTFDQYFKGEHVYLKGHVFIATEWQGEPTESEEMAPKWFSVDSIPYDTMWPDDPYWLPLILDGKKIKASFVMDEKDVVLEHQVEEVAGF